MCRTVNHNTVSRLDENVQNAMTYMLKMTIKVRHGRFIEHDALSHRVQMSAEMSFRAGTVHSRQNKRWTG